MMALGLALVMLSCSPSESFLRTPLEVGPSPWL